MCSLVSDVLNSKEPTYQHVKIKTKKLGFIQRRVTALTHSLTSICSSFFNFIVIVCVKNLIFSLRLFFRNVISIGWIKIRYNQYPFFVCNLYVSTKFHNKCIVIIIINYSQPAINKKSNADRLFIHLEFARPYLYKRGFVSVL